MRVTGLENYKDEVAFAAFGRSRVLALAGSQCVKCGASVVLQSEDMTYPHPGGRLDFRDEISEREYKLSAFCQSCQDDTFGA